MIFLLFFILSLSAEIIEIDDFSSYKNRDEFLKNWKSRSKNYKKVLNENPFYYYIKEDKNNKILCSALRMNPENKDDLNLKDSIPAISVYKDYWKKDIDIGKLHKQGKKVYLEWEWIVYKTPEGTDESIPSLDDNVLSVYPVLHLGWIRFRSIKYIWSSSKNIGAVERYKKEKEKRAYVIRNSNDKLGVWYKESINISEHIKDFLPDYYNNLSIVGIAVMSDSDNTKKPSYGCVDNIKLVIRD